jgi:hypothetical protein
MLARLLAHYPTANLISELLQIHEGKFVVRVEIEVDGVTRVTGLAAAENLELAEDRARSRALMVLLPDTDSGVQPGGTAPYPTIVSEAQPFVKHSQSYSGADKIQPSDEATSSEWSNGTNSPLKAVPPDNEPMLTPDNLPQSAAQNKDNSVGATSRTHTDVTSSPVKRNLVKSGEPSDSNTPSSNERSPINGEGASSVREGAAVNIDSSTLGQISQHTAAPSRTEQFPAPDFTGLSLASGQTYDAVSEKDEPVIIPFGDEEPPKSYSYEEPPESYDYEEPPESYDYEEPPESYDYSYEKNVPEPEPKPKAKKTVNMTEAFAQTTTELKRLEWNTQQGRSYLKQKYGKTSRQQLTNDELLEFLAYLESQPTPNQLPFEP